VTNHPITLKALVTQYGGILTVQQAESHGLNRQTLIRASQAGWLERIQRGVYRLIDAPIQPFEAELEVQLRIPKAVITLGNALAFHGLTTFIPKVVEISLQRGNITPRLLYPKIKIYYTPALIHQYGIQNHQLRGQILRVYSPEKTLMDLVRRKQDILFAEGMKRYLLNPNKDFPALIAAARVCRVEDQIIDLLRVEGFNANV
jgi:predicted transcriptional regulator of viral defense system